MEREQVIELAVHRGDPSQAWDVGTLEFGPLLGALTMQPRHISGEEGKLRVEITRTHEWELVVGLILAGGAIFAKKIIEKIAELLFNWSLDQAQKIKAKGKPKLGTSDGRITVINDSDPVGTVAGIASLLELASKNNLRIQLVIEPKE